MKRLATLLGGSFILLITGCTVEASPEPATPLPSATQEPTEIVQSSPTEVPPTSTPRPTTAPICTSLQAAADQEGDLYWWNDKVFYEIFVRSFFDSDADGIGDFNGITQKLDYLNDGDPNTDTDLGITGIWLMPINLSPSYHGYDVSDYFEVNPEYGTMEDFQNLLQEARQRDISVIVDLVLNHTSTDHPWFQNASTDPESPYRDYYIFADSPGGYKSPWGSDVWHSADTGFYYGIFWAGMPDLNYTSPVVVEEMQEVVRYWLEDIGVDGFRLDAIKHIVEDGEIQENTPATHVFWEGFYDHYTSINPDAFTIGEAWTSTGEVVKYIGDEVSIAFEFDTAGAMVEAARSGHNSQIRKAHDLVLNSYPPHQYGTFLTNHDQPRVMNTFLGDFGKAKTAASLLLTGPGVPFIYYGEEVGQRGGKPDENIRTPMQWSSETNAGFTEAEMPWRLPQRDYADFNVADQTDDPTSLLNHYRKLIKARTNYPALSSGDMLLLPTANRGVYAFLRYTGEEVIMVVINLTKNPISDYRFCLNDGGLVAVSPIEILHAVEVNTPSINDSGGFDDYRPIDELEPYSSYIIQLK
jgi:glycosidase